VDGEHGRSDHVGRANYFAFYIDADDHAHIAYDETGTVALKYRRNKSISTTSAWSAASTVDSTTALSYQWADMVAHREGTGWKAHILYKRNTTGTDLMLWAPITITSADVITVETKVTVDSDVGASATVLVGSTSITPPVMRKQSRVPPHTCTWCGATARCQ
jgi:hypothetical protein